LNVAGVVAALDREARTLGPAVEGSAGFGTLAGGTLRAVSGMGCAAAGMAARRLVDAGATALVSWGLAGGLDPELEAGAICLPREVVAPDGVRFAAAASWRETLMASVVSSRPVTSGALLTSLYPLAGVAAKAAARRDSGAVAVDMESSAVAEVALACRLPFLAVRVIVDTALDAIPASVTVAAGASGEMRIGRLLLGLARSPREIMPLARLARCYGAAIRSLRAIAALERMTPPAGAGHDGGGRFTRGRA
jgi:adenosylhomocysteine nucleosidase